jgi:hypothetical protein
MGKVIIVSGEGSKSLCEELAEAGKARLIQLDFSLANFSASLLGSILFRVRCLEPQFKTLIVDMGDIPALGAFGMHELRKNTSVIFEFIRTGDYKWFAIDYKGDTRLYAAKPYLSESSGSYRSEYLTKDLNFKVSCRDWRKSLTEL